MPFRQGPALPVVGNEGDYFLNNLTLDLYVCIAPNTWKWVKRDPLVLDPKMVLNTVAELSPATIAGTFALILADNSLWVKFPAAWHEIKTQKP